MSTPRCVFTATLLPNGKVLAAGGANEVAYIDSAELYDFRTGMWSSTGSMLAARSVVRFGNVLILACR